MKVGDKVTVIDNSGGLTLKEGVLDWHDLYKGSHSEVCTIVALNMDLPAYNWPTGKRRRNDTILAVDGKMYFTKQKYLRAYIDPEAEKRRIARQEELKRNQRINSMRLKLDKALIYGSNATKDKVLDQLESIVFASKVRDIPSDSFKVKINLDTYDQYIQGLLTKACFVPPKH